MKRLLKWIGVLLSFPAWAQPAQNVILITMDGVRWQEVFNGADSTLLNDPAYGRDTAAAHRDFWAPTPEARRKLLMPFFWETVSRQGQLYGNRQRSSRVNVSNPYWFSYPGYNEILSGFADDRINSNDKKNNKNTTVLGFLNEQPALRGKVAVFSSWNVIEAAVNEPGTGILANSANEPVRAGTSADSLLNDMMTLQPHEWGPDVRADHLTYFAGRSYLKQHKPRVLFLSFDETDELAHAGRYADHLQKLRMLDRLFADLWQTIQKMPEYAGKTALIFTTDHGRGHTPKARWKDHGTKTADSYQIWLAGVGAGIPATGEQTGGPVLYQNQIAATLASLLGYEFTCEHPVGAPITTLITPKK